MNDVMNLLNRKRDLLVKKLDSEKDLDRIRKYLRILDQTDQMRKEIFEAENAKLGRWTL